MEKVYNFTCSCGHKYVNENSQAKCPQCGKENQNNGSFEPKK